MAKAIVISGCDDTTYIQEKDWGRPFTPDEVFTIEKICALSQQLSIYMCMPIVKFRELDDWEIEDLEEDDENKPSELSKKIDEEFAKDAYRVELTEADKELLEGMSIKVMESGE